MAKSKKKVEEEIEEKPEEIKVLPEVEKYDEPEVQTTEVDSLTAAEQFQKGGWQLIDCHQTPSGKVYKFKKGK